MRDMPAKVEIPKGWRVVKRGLFQEGDRMLQIYDRATWQPVRRHWIGTYRIVPVGLIIRRVAKAKAQKK